MSSPFSWEQPLTGVHHSTVSDIILQSCIRPPVVDEPLNRNVTCLLPKQEPQDTAGVIVRDHPRLHSENRNDVSLPGCAWRVQIVDAEWVTGQLSTFIFSDMEGASSTQLPTVLLVNRSSASASEVRVVHTVGGGGGGGLASASGDKSLKRRCGLCHSSTCVDGASGAATQSWLTELMLIAGDAVHDPSTSWRLIIPALSDAASSRMSSRWDDHTPGC